MRITGADHVNRGTRQIISLISSLAVAVTVFRFGAAHIQAQRSAERSA